MVEDIQSTNQHQLQVCIGTDTNKASDTGVLNNGGKRQAYKIIWWQSYKCARGGKPRYKTSSKGTQKKEAKVRNDQAVD